MDTIIKVIDNDIYTGVNEKGLTLVELMIALCMFLIVIAGIYQTFDFQQKAYMNTDARVNMVQEGRAAQFFLARDLKMSGYNPTAIARTGFNKATAAETSFTMDIAADGNPADVEIITFALTENNGEIVEGGICPDDTTCRLSREWCEDWNNCGGLQPVAENVEAIELCYILGNVQATTEPNTLEREHITAVIVSLLMKQSYRSNDYRNTNVYMPASGDQVLTPVFIGDRSEGWGPFNDGYHRKLIVFEIRARNMGLNPYVDLGT